MSVSPPIQLSLAGNGKLVILTPETVRKAFFQFTKVNPEYTGREKYKLEYPCFEQTSIYYKKHNNIYYYYNSYYGDRRDYQQRDATILDTLHRSYLDPTLSYLHPQDIQRVERQINKYILNYGLALVKDEGKIQEGYINCHQLGKNRYKVKYIMRYGMFFILELIFRETMMKMRDVDLFIQDTETYDFHLVRYKGVLLSSLKSKIQLLFANRLDFSKIWTQTVEEFKPRQIFLIKKIYPCEGFCLI